MMMRQSHFILYTKSKNERVVSGRRVLCDWQLTGNYFICSPASQLPPRNRRLI